MRRSRTNLRSLSGTDRDRDRPGRRVTRRKPTIEVDFWSGAESIRRVLHFFFGCWSKSVYAHKRCQHWALHGGMHSTAWCDEMWF